MTIMYLADSVTNKCLGVHEGFTIPAGTYDTLTPFNDSREVWVGGVGPWTLSNTDKEQDERNWRDGELRLTDWTQLPDLALTAQQITNWVAYRVELRDMPTLLGFPDTHTRPSLL